MRNISSEFREALKSDNRKYRVYASISLKDGTELNITNENLWQGGFSMEDSVSSSDSFDVGAAIVNKFTLTINNIDDSFSEYDFTDATAVVLMSIKINDEKETEKIRMCSGNISEPPKEYSSIITLSFYRSATSRSMQASSRWPRRPRSSAFRSRRRTTIPSTMRTTASRVATSCWIAC